MFRKSVESEVLDFIQSRQSGKIYHATDFSNLYPRDTIKKALQRLEKQEKLIRLAPGIYLYPKYDPVIGPIYPTMAEIALEVAKKDKRRIIPTGDQALLQLGLSTQVPMKSVYLTDGHLKNIKIGNRMLIFRPTSSSALALKGKISGPIIQAMKALGKEGITEETIDKIAALLKRENPIIAESDASFAPAWIRSIMLNIIKANN